MLRATGLQARPVKSICVDGQAGLEREKMRIGRNDPCPCGSGRKYKKCCGNPSKENTATARTIPPDVLAQLVKRREDRRKYFFDNIGENGQLGEVTTATVNETDKQVLFSVTAEDGLSYILSEPISDGALADYKAHPEAFFGAVQPVGGRVDNVYELFEFFVNCYKGSTKEQLLELMKDAADIEVLRQMEQIDLAIEYAERCLSVVPNLPKNQLIPM